MRNYDYKIGKNDYLTPPWLLSQVLEENELKYFDLDVCCSFPWVSAKKHYIFPKYDGLKEPWEKHNWCNPPFSTCEDWVKKAYQEQQKGNITYMLLPVRTETKFWHDFILNNPDANIRFLRKTKNLCFYDPNTKEPVKMKITNKRTGEVKYINGVYKNALAIVIFKGANSGQ